ncbi:hypothetical protein JKP88DRAFT_347131 [Tribonema minus]|uniref:Uncharacterized protein n=1 Tax=Tribonema minus TaxID=303371 RepID=A0A836C8H8_9STRA|nr:hypothetical protein JKP88DRAFT_347131 [Tribonema minus]
MANRTNASCDEDHIRHLLMMVATGVNRLREKHPWLDGLPRGDGGINAQQPVVQPHVAMELDNAERILTALKAACDASSSSRPAKPFADRLEPMLVFVHGGEAFHIKDRELSQLLNNSPRAMVQVGCAELSCDVIRAAMDAGLTVDGNVLIGGAERCCKAALDQWHQSLLQRSAWRAQQTWVLPVMALRAIGVRERPEALKLLRWVFNTATLKRGEVQLPPVLLTMLAFKCARYGHFDAFCWLYTEGRQLAQQDITATFSLADFNAFKGEVAVPFRAACTDEFLFIRMLPPDTTESLCTLMDTAIQYGQEKFVVALSRFDVAPELASFTPKTALIVCQVKDLNASGVVRMVSDLACQWGRWTSAECALVRGRSQQPSSAPPRSAQHWMQQLHALGCPCTCARLRGAEDV